MKAVKHHRELDNTFSCYFFIPYDVQYAINRFSPIIRSYINMKKNSVNQKK